MVLLLEPQEEKKWNLDRTFHKSRTDVGFRYLGGLSVLLVFDEGPFIQLVAFSTTSIHSFVQACSSFKEFQHQ